MTPSRRDAVGAPVEGTLSELAALADEIANRLDERLGLRLAQIATSEAAVEGARTGDWWSAKQVAAHYGVTPGFVYQHADELGCVRLGGGRRARLRFDPRTVRERWSDLGDSLPPIAPQRRSRESTARRTRRSKQRGYELLEFDHEP